MIKISLFLSFGELIGWEQVEMIWELGLPVAQRLKMILES